MTAMLDQHGKQDDVKHRLLFGFHLLFNPVKRWAAFKRCASRDEHQEMKFQAKVDCLDIDKD